MTVPLTDERLAELRELIEAADLPMPIEMDYHVDPELSCVIGVMTAGDGIEARIYTEETARLIEAALNLLPALLTELDQLRAEVVRLRAGLAAVRELAIQWRATATDLQLVSAGSAVLARLNAAVLPALPKRDRGATQAVLTVACPTCQAKPGVACTNRAAEHSHIKRRLVHGGAVITDPTPAVALTDADMADMGLDPETGLHVRNTPDAAPVVAEEACCHRPAGTCHWDGCSEPRAIGHPLACPVHVEAAARLKAKYDATRDAAPAVGPAATDRPVA